MGTVLTLYLVLILVGAPFIAWRAAASGAIVQTPRLVLYRTAVLTSWLLALLGGAVLWWDQSLAPADVGLTGLSAGHFLIASAVTLIALLLVALGMSGVQRLAGASESPQLIHMIPRNGNERSFFVALALTAGITEEFVFRGIAITTLSGTTWFTGAYGPWAAALLVSLAFGLGHGYQEFWGVVRASLLGFGLAVPFLLTGSLLPGIVAHTLVDLTLLGPSGRRLVAASP